MNAIKLSLKQREQLGIEYVNDDETKVSILKTIMFDNDNTERKFKNNYRIDFEKISDEIDKKNKNFQGVKMKDKEDFTIDESEQDHFTQIMYIIQQDCYLGNKWIGWEEPFTVKYLNDICKKDYNIYIENWGEIGPKFVKDFPNKIEYFVDNFCKVVS